MVYSTSEQVDQEYGEEQSSEGGQAKWFQLYASARIGSNLRSASAHWERGWVKGYNELKVFLCFLGKRGMHQFRAASLLTICTQPFSIIYSLCRRETGLKSDAHIREERYQAQGRAVHKKRRHNDWIQSRVSSLHNDLSAQSALSAGSDGYGKLTYAS